MQFLEYVCRFKHIMFMGVCKLWPTGLIIHIHLCTHCPQLLSQYNSQSVVVTKTVWPRKPKIITVWPLQKQFSDSRNKSPKLLSPSAK